MSRNIPFNSYEGFSKERQEQLNNYARRLLDKNAGDGSISFTEFGSMLNELSATGLTTVEKCNVWSTVAIQKERYAISLVGLKEENIDTFRPGTSAGHVVIHFNDGYHCPLANLPINEAFDRIVAHEQNEGGTGGRFIRWVVGGVSGSGSLNTGDATASLNQVLALKQFLEGGFAAYAREWNTRFLKR